MILFSRIKNDILTMAWNMATDSESDKRERMQGLTLAKECYAMKLDLLSSSTVVERAVNFVNKGLTQQNREVVIDGPIESITNSG